MIKTLQTPKHNRNKVIAEIDIKIHNIFHRYFQYWYKTEDMMKHAVTYITNRKCNPNDVITLIKNLCQPDVGCYEKYGTNINVTNNSLYTGYKNPLCNITIMLPPLQNGASFCYNDYRKQI